MAIISQQNWLIQKFIMEDILKKLPKMSLDTPFYGMRGVFWDPERQQGNGRSKRGNNES